MPEEPGHAEADALLGDLFAHGTEALAPDVFPYEIGNALKRLRATDAERVATLIRAASIPKLLRPSLDSHRAALGLSVASRISYYDATYVVAAQEHATTLWTEDGEIIAKFPELAQSTTMLRERRRP